jgi:glycosyltransferase involved in cell wall biosynthesis
VTDGGGPLRVAMVVPRLTGGGAEYVACEWAAYLRRLGHEVTLVTTHDADSTPAVAGVHQLTAASFPARVRQLRDHVSHSTYDVVVGLMPHWNLLVLMSVLGGGPGAPATVISGHNVERALRRVPGRRKSSESLLARLLYRRADAFIGVSHPVAAEAASEYGLDPEQLWVVPNPAAGKHPLPQLDRGHGPAHRRTVTLTVPARLVPQKCPGVAVETAAVLASRHGVTARVEYFGDGPEEEAVRALAERLGVDLTFRGWVTAWFDEAARDAVVLLPSAAEGFGNVLVEAAAAGIASVASSRALGVGDAVVPQVTGVLAMTGGPEDLAEAVVEAMGLTPVTATRWVQRFSPEESGRRLLRVLRAVTSHRPRGADRPASLDEELVDVVTTAGPPVLVRD